jgi:hypothetical protein
LFSASLPFADLDEAARRFESCQISKAEWTHQAHLAIGMWHVYTYGPDDALKRLRVGIRRLNDSHGTPNTETNGYHETITRAYVDVLSLFLAASDNSIPLAARVVQLLSGPLAARDVLLRFYSRELLMSKRARAEWVEPDITPISMTAAR